ncbi:hypothetical protein AAHB53_27800 [Niallia circulans]
MGKSTDLKLTKKKVKEVHETEKYELDDGSTITFYPLFPHTKIYELHEELQKVLSTKDENVKVTDKIAFALINFFIIKHFTHFKSQLKATTFNDVLGEMNALIDLRVDNDESAFEFILNDLFSLLKLIRYITMQLNTLHNLSTLLNYKIWFRMRFLN